MEKKDIQTIDEAWRKQMESLCASFQKRKGQMIIVATQPDRPLFACCTARVKRQMMRNFSTFKECLKIQKSLGSFSSTVRPCCLCLTVPEKEDVRDCETEDVKSALGIKVPTGAKVCIDCSDNLHKFLYFKKKITEIHSRQNKASKSKACIPTHQGNVEKQVSKGPGTQVTKAHGNIHENNNRHEAFCGLEMTVDLVEDDEKGINDHCYNQTQKSPTANTEDQHVAQSSLTQIKEGTHSEKTTGKQSKAIFAQEASTKPSRITIPMIKSESNAECLVPAENNYKTQKLSQTMTDTIQLSFKISDVRSLKPDVSSLKLVENSQTNSQKPGILRSLMTADNQELSRIGGNTMTTPVLLAPLPSTLPPNKQALAIKKEASPIPNPQKGAITPSNPQTQANVRPDPQNKASNTPHPQKGAITPSNPQTQANIRPDPQNKASGTPHPQKEAITPSNPQTQANLRPDPQNKPSPTPHQQETPSTISMVLLGDSKTFCLVQHPPPKGSTPLAQSQVLLQPSMPGTSPVVFPPGVGSVMPVPVSSSPSNTQKKTQTVTYVPIQSKMPESPQTKSATVALSPPQRNLSSVPLTTRTITSPALPVLLNLNNAEDLKKKPAAPVDKAVLSSASSELTPVPPAFILALPSCLPTTTPIQIISPLSSKAQSLMPAHVVSSTGANLAQKVSDGSKQPNVTDVKTEVQIISSGASPLAESDSRQKLPVTTQQENMLSCAKSSFFKIGKMTYQLVCRNNKQFLVPTIYDLPDKPSSSTEKKRTRELEMNKFFPLKRKLTSENPEEGFPKRLKASNMQVKPKDKDGCSESESDPEDIEIEDEEMLVKAEKVPISRVPITDHDYSVRQAPMRPVICRSCPFAALYWRAMADHMRTHQMKRYCIKCNDFLKNKFESHACNRRALKRTRKHICLVCSRLLNSAFDLFKHYRVKHQTEVEKKSHSNSLYRSVRSQNVFICRGCFHVEFSEASMLSHVKKFHVCGPNEDSSNYQPELLKSEPVHACPVCWFHFPEKKYLDYHMEVFHVKKPSAELVCCLCNECFTNSTDLINHLSSHQCNIKYRCGICKQQTDPMNSLEELRNHGKTLHPTNSLHAILLCPFTDCEKTFQEDTEFLLHITQHEIENKFMNKCSNCPFSATSESLLTSHEKSFHYEPDKRCLICTKRFSTPAALKAHIDKHNRERDPELFICDRCGKMNNSRAQHRMHMKNHRYSDTAKPQPCKHCGEIFSKRRELAMHIVKKHPEVKVSHIPPQFPCLYCDFSSFSRVDFQRHMMSHKRVKPFVCDFCERCYRDKEKFLMHVKHHKEGRNTKMFRCFACHLDRDNTEMRTHLNAEAHRLNCELGGLNCQDYNQDLFQLFPSKIAASPMARKKYAETSLRAECRRVHDEHCKRAEGSQVGQERSYTVYTPEGEELLIEVPPNTPQCPECGLMFKSETDLLEHKEHVKILDTVATRNNYRCQVCDIYLFGRLAVAQHARCQHHVNMCRNQGVEPENVLDKNKISRDFYANSKKDSHSWGYKCKVCDIFFAFKGSKDSHLRKQVHIEKCQEQGLDPDGDHIENYAQEGKVAKKKKREKSKPKKPKVEGGKAINRSVKKLFTIDLLGVEVPRNIAFICHVCNISLSTRIQALDHLHMPRHINSCLTKGVLSGTENLCLQVRIDDYSSVAGKSISQVLGVPSDAVFPLTEQERTLYQSQIQEAESSGVKTKGRPESLLEHATENQTVLPLTSVGEPPHATENQTALPLASVDGPPHATENQTALPLTSVGGPPHATENQTALPLASVGGTPQIVLANRSQRQSLATVQLITNTAENSVPLPVSTNIAVPVSLMINPIAPSVTVKTKPLLQNTPQLRRVLTENTSPNNDVAPHQSSHPSSGEDNEAAGTDHLIPPKTQGRLPSMNEDNKLPEVVSNTPSNISPFPDAEDIYLDSYEAKNSC